jgi:hypothetical protein
VNDNQCNIDLTKPLCETYLDSAVILELQEQSAKQSFPQFMNRHERRREAAIDRQWGKAAKRAKRNGA